jgi:hypothetical protein
VLANVKQLYGVIELQKGYEWTGEGLLRFSPPPPNRSGLDFSGKGKIPGTDLRCTYAAITHLSILLDGKKIGQPKIYWHAEAESIRLFPRIWR